MKQFKYILIVAIMALITSCNESVLDKEPLDVISDKAVFVDETLMDAYLTEVYIEMVMLINETPSPTSSDWNVNKNSADIAGPFIINEMADEAKSNWWNDKQSVGAKLGGIRIQGGVLEWWEISYRVIRMLNYFIANVQDSPIEDTAFKKQKEAEARFLRAYNYFAMVKRYGGVPLVKVALNIDAPEEEIYAPRNKEQEIYDFIISEMDAITDDLPESGTSGRPSKYAALALKCRAALYAGSIAQYGTVQLDGIIGIDPSKATDYYKESHDAALKIVNSGKFALYDEIDNKVQNFKNIFLIKNNSEVIWAVRHNDIAWIAGQPSGNGWVWDFMQCPKPQAWNAGNVNAPYLEMAEDFEHIDGTPGILDRDAIQQGLWSMADLWKSKDPRFFATLYTQNTSWQGTSVDFHNGIIKPNGELLEIGSFGGTLAQGSQQIDGSYGTGFGVMKYLDESHSNMGERGTSQTDWQIFRYAEVLLNMAEASFELGKVSEAINCINQIRTRAGIATVNSIDHNIIRHERKVELAFEGHRYWDLRRWRIATEMLTVNRSGLRFILDFVTKKFKIVVEDRIDSGISDPLFFDYNYYFPITLDRTANNPNLVENPGYK